MAAVDRERQHIKVYFRMNPKTYTFAKICECDGMSLQIQKPTVQWGKRAETKTQHSNILVFYN